MTSSLKRHLDFIKLLALTHKTQRVQLLRTIDNQQFDILLEITFNILNGVCPLTKKEEINLRRNKASLRKLVDNKIAKRIKKQILLNIQRLLPILLSPVIRYFSQDGKGGNVSSEREISEVIGKSQEEYE